MLDVATKAHILEAAGYAFNFDREIYLNKTVRKAFSIDFIEDHSEAELLAKITEAARPEAGWKFYFNAEPSEGVKRQLSAVLG